MDLTGLPDDWRPALESAAERILVLGATDMGKSSFIRALAAVRAAAGSETHLVDLDPGQKMVGPPGSASRGRIGSDGGAVLDRFIFLGTTSASSLVGISRAAAELAGGAGPEVVNTAGFVRGLGARLQALTIRAVRPDLIVAIGGGLEPILQAFPQTPAMRLSRPVLARTKSPSARTALRQAAFEEALRGAVPHAFGGDGPVLEPGPPVAFSGTARPVCALADSDGIDRAIGLVEAAGPLRVFAPPAARTVQRVRLGRMWAEPGPAGWKLLERLAPAWEPPAR